MWHGLLWLLGVSLVINTAMLLVAFRLRSDKLTDISYALTFVVLATLLLVNSDISSYALLGLGMIFLWALRIGSFLLYRVLKTGKDSRFDGIREDFWKFAKFWGGQAITAWVLMIPAALAFTSRADWGNLAYGGVAIWLAGFLIECVADVQKIRFNSDSRNRGWWIDSGLWRYSRHPNYFGEILVWVGLYVYAISNLSPAASLIALVSPLFITFLLLFVSGVPPLEKMADKRWGNKPAYQRYKRQTSVLILLSKKSDR